MDKRRAVSVNWMAEMWSEEGIDFIGLRECGYESPLSLFIRIMPPSGAWKKVVGPFYNEVDQDTNLLLTILWFQGR